MSRLKNFSSPPPMPRPRFSSAATAPARARPASLEGCGWGCLILRRSGRRERERESERASGRGRRRTIDALYCTEKKEKTLRIRSKFLRRIRSCVEVVGVLNRRSTECALNCGVFVVKCQDIQAVDRGIARAMRAPASCGHRHVSSMLPRLTPGAGARPSRLPQPFRVGVRALVYIIYAPLGP